MSDTTVKCDKCGREARVRFAECLRRGWPECCGYTMRLVNYPPIMPAIKEAFGAEVKAIREGNLYE